MPTDQIIILKDYHVQEKVLKILIAEGWKTVEEH